MTYVLTGCAQSAVGSILRRVAQDQCRTPELGTCVHVYIHSPVVCVRARVRVSNPGIPL